MEQTGAKTVKMKTPENIGPNQAKTSRNIKPNWTKTPETLGPNRTLISRKILEQTGAKTWKNFGPHHASLVYSLWCYDKTGPKYQRNTGPNQAKTNWAKHRGILDQIGLKHQIT